MLQCQRSACCGLAFVAALLILCPIGPISAQNERTPVIYVSDNGNDSADGLTAQTPLRTLEKALTVARANNGPANINLSGRFVLNAPLHLTAADSGLSLTSDDRAEISGAMNVADGIIVSGADGVKISGLFLTNFTGNGIFVESSQNVWIYNNIVRNISSSSWSRGAIHFFGNIRNGRIMGNIIDSSDYAGIIVDTNESSDVSDFQITGNTVKNTCQKVADCGAIYINDRGRNSRNITISKNNIMNFGDTSTKGRAIYLDDFASYVTVVDNFISGHGSYAFQIHGGHDNTISHNHIDMDAIDQPILYQPVSSRPWETMSNNVLSRNAFTNTQFHALTPGSLRLTTSSRWPLRVLMNRWCSNGICQQLR